MRAGIVAANNIRYSPYIFFYTRVLDRMNLSYDLIVPDRNGLNEISEQSVKLLPWNNKFPTIVNYIRYTHSVKKMLKKKEYNLVIVLTGINAAFLGLWLKRHYRKKYIVDIRDYSHENIYPYYLLEKTAVNYSLLNIISSQKFTEFLPKSTYLVCHNYDDNAYGEAHFEKHSEPIRIGYVGGLSYPEQCIKLMKLISQDQRFVLEYYGTSDLEPYLQEEAKTFQCDRIVFHGGYTPHEKAGILQCVDILFNAYGNGKPLLDYALSNKLYDSLVYKKPILTCANTYMTEMAGPLAFPIDLDDSNALDKLYDWYQDIDCREIEEYADTMIEMIRNENRETQESIARSIKEILYPNEK